MSSATRLPLSSLVAILSPDRLMQLVILLRLDDVSRFRLLSRVVYEAVQELFGHRLTYLSCWARGIWSAWPGTLQRVAIAAASPPLLPALRVLLLEALDDIAHAKNRRPLRVRTLCYSARPHGISLRFDFRCPRRHGVLQKVRGVPASYSMHHGTDDLTLSCSNCDRGSIEEDQMIFHCPRFGCCYDLCLLCAEDLVTHRREDGRADDILASVDALDHAAACRGAGSVHLSHRRRSA